MRSINTRSFFRAALMLSLWIAGCAPGQGTGLLTVSLTSDGSLRPAVASRLVFSIPGTKDRSYTQTAFPPQGGEALVVQLPGLPAGTSPIKVTVQAWTSGGCLIGSGSNQATIKGGAKTTLGIVLSKEPTECGDPPATSSDASVDAARDGLASRTDAPFVPVDGGNDDAGDTDATPSPRDTGSLGQTDASDAPFVPGTGGVQASGGVVASTGGALGATGGQTTTGGIVVVTGGTVASTGGIVVQTGGIVVQSGGVSSTGGVIVSTGGISATGGIVASTGGIVVQTGGIVPATGGIATGGVTNPSTGGILGTGGADAGSTGGSTAVRSPGCDKAPVTFQLGTSSYALNSGGLDRSFTATIPLDYNPAKPYRVVFAMHYLGGNAAGVVNASYYHLKPLDTNATTIWVAPQGYTSTNPWRDGDDLDHVFFQDLVTMFKNGLCIDSSRIFAVGFSSGAVFTNALAQVFQDTLRGVVMYAANDSIIYFPTNSGKPLAYFGVHGQNDALITIPQGRKSRDRFVVNNGCTSPATVPEASPGSTIHVCYDFPCPGQYPVRWCTHGGAHTDSPTDTGQTSSWVPAATWDFITQF